MKEQNKTPRKRSPVLEKVWSPEIVQQIGKDLIEWCKVPDKNWHISGFEAETNLPSEWAKNMAKTRGDEFLEIYRTAKAILGRKLLERAMDGKANQWVISTLIPHYIKDIDDRIDRVKKKELEMNEAIKRASEDKQAEKTVELLAAMQQYINATK